MQLFIIIIFSPLFSTQLSWYHNASMDQHPSQQSLSVSDEEELQWYGCI